MEILKICGLKGQRLQGYTTTRLKLFQLIDVLKNSSEINLTFVD